MEQIPTWPGAAQGLRRDHNRRVRDNGEIIFSDGAASIPQASLPRLRPPAAVRAVSLPETERICELYASGGGRDFMRPITQDL